jgi:two-component system OmpR family sensor kinase
MTGDRADADESILRRAAWRIGLQTAAAVAIVVIGLGAIAVLVVLGSQHQANDRLINMDIARADDVTDPPAGVWLVIQRDGHQVATADLPPGLPDQAQIDAVAADDVTRQIDLTAAHRQYRVKTTATTDGRVIQLLLDLTADHAERDRLLAAFAISGIAGLPLSAGIGFWLARRAVAPLAAALALQRRFVADAGHELRTPLTLLSTRAQLVRRALGVAAVSPHVDGLVADARHLADILDELLLAADPRDRPADELVGLPELVSQATDSARPRADELGVTLTCQTLGEPSPVLGARAGLRRAFTALLDNAIRHADGEVRVTVRSIGRDMVVDVADDGPGIAPDIESRMFERFATSPSDAKPGMRRRYGLGLALVSEVAARHAGSVSVIDAQRPGATLRLRLPAAPRPTTSTGSSTLTR